MANIERLGDILIKKGVLNYAQLTQALEFQAKLSENNYMPLGEILISFGFISRNTLVETLNAQGVPATPPPPPPPPMPPPPPPPSDDPNRKMTFSPPPKPPAKEVPNAPAPPVYNTAQVGQRHKPIGEILIEKGYLDRSKLSSALQYQAVLPPTHFKQLGEILIELHYITREQLNEALGIQPVIKPNSLGEILKQLGIIDDSMLALVLAQQHSVGGQSVPVGELLVQHGFITRAQLEQALAEQKRRQ